MRTIRLPLLAVAAVALSPAAASASVAHTVTPGETLWTIAAAHNLTTRAFAAANGLAPDAQVIAGSTLKIPTVSEAASALASAPAASPAAGAAAMTTSTAPPALGGYTVRAGDTLSELAATSRVPAAQIAQMNGLDPDGPLLAGTVLKLPTGSPTPAGASAPAPSIRRVPVASPEPTATRVSASDIAAVAARNGVPSSLASAIAWQESGFNNGMVSSANARGVMQVMPGTWDYVQANLARRTLDPNSATDNVGAGVLYLGQLLQQTGGDPALAAAGYYQGLASVRRIGMLPETRQYVDNVLALRSRFGG
jgi:LysM repeat protein